MKRRAAALALSVCLLGGALPARAASFTDVSGESWYAPYVDYVSEKKVMLGVGDGYFAPERELTRAECLAMAVRLYDLRRGGDGVLRTAPADWGHATLTTADGRSLTRQGQDWDWTYLSKGDGGHLSILLDSDGLLDWGREQAGKTATLEMEGQSWTGIVTLRETELVSDYVPRIYFDCDSLAGTQEYAELNQMLYRLHFRRPAAEKWYQSAYYTADRLNLYSQRAFDDLMILPHAEEPATRLVFARALAAAAGELEKTISTDSIPDVERYLYDGAVNNLDIYGLYEAGVLNGVDALGTFAGDRTLTRMECAAMAARVLEPELRLKGR